MTKDKTPRTDLNESTEIKGSATPTISEDDHISARIRPMHVRDIMVHKTDKGHGLTIPEVIQELKARGIEASAPAVKRDLRLLAEYGFINYTTERRPGQGNSVEYRNELQRFSIDEVQLLCDAVQSIELIDTPKKAHFIQLMKDLLPEPEQEALALATPAETKAYDEALARMLFARLDIIREAIAHGKNLRIKLYGYDLQGKRVRIDPVDARRKYNVYFYNPEYSEWFDATMVGTTIDELELDGFPLEFTPKFTDLENEGAIFFPLELAFSNGRYYVIGYYNPDEETFPEQYSDDWDGTDPDYPRTILALRVDRMEIMGDGEAAFKWRAIDKGYRPKRFMHDWFGPIWDDYDAKEVTLEVSEPYVIDDLMDRYGTSLKVKPVDENTSTVTIPVKPSPEFYGWLFSCEGAAKILSPHNMATTYLYLLKEALKRSE